MDKLLFVLVLILAILCVLIFTGVIDTTRAESDRDFTFYSAIDNRFATFIMVDELTHVEYIVIGEEKQFGITLAITPRLYADGSLVIAGG